jgi:hypothetical protein
MTPAFRLLLLLLLLAVIQWWRPRGSGSRPSVLAAPPILGHS